MELGSRLIPFHEGWQRQRDVHGEVAEGRRPSTLLLVEHEPVYTVGRRAHSWERPSADVVEPGHRAVLVAVDRFITVRITPCSPSGEYAGTISSRLYANGSRSWRRRPQDGQAEAVGGEDDYIISAIRVVEALVTQGGGRPRSFDLSVSSELEEDDGRKLGLGSSSAVTVATVRAVATFYGMAADDLTVYKLAMLASDAVQPIGSGGGIAGRAATGRGAAPAAAPYGSQTEAGVGPRETRS